MDVERTVLEHRARVHAALADVARLRMVDRLLIGDAAPGELAALLGQTTNLVAHHIGVLEAAGAVRRERSEGDRRRSYVSLVPGALSGLVTAPVFHADRVVFVCTHNSARSQLAAALLSPRTRVRVASAGTEPASRVHPRAVRVARRHGLNLSHLRPRHIDDVLQHDDVVISVCDVAHESLNRRPVVHWSVPDPARLDTDAAFESTYQNLAERVDRLATVLNGDTRA